MIEKVIHYCWFGGGHSEIELQCMESWKIKLPGYKIIKWDETNFPINEHPYAKQAYDAKKWAFVSDYVRVWVLLITVASTWIQTTRLLIH